MDNTLQKFGDYEQVLPLDGQVQQLELPPAATHGGVVGNQFTDTARIDVLHPSQIQKDLLIAAGNQTSDRAAQGGGAVADANFAIEIQNRDIAGLSLFYV